MKRLTGTNKEIAELLYQEQLELSKENRDVERTVQAIIEDVKERGDEALRDYSAKFDKVDLTDIEVGQDLIDKAFKEIDPEVYQALVNAKENIEFFSKYKNLVSYYSDEEEISYNKNLEDDYSDGNRLV